MLIKMRSLGRLVALSFSLVYLGWAYNGFMMSIPQPVMGATSTSRARVALSKVGAPQDKINDLSIAVASAAAITDISPELLVALIKTESEFDYEAVSNKGYKGLMQTPMATMKWAEVDVLIGAKILQEKLRYSKDDLKLALALYKGGNNKLAKRYAAETYQLYRSLL